MFFNEFSTSPKGECWKISVALNSKIDNQSNSVTGGVRGSELIAGDESGIPLTLILPGIESVCGSNGADSMASDGANCSGSQAVAVAGTVSRVWSDDRFKTCSSERRGAIAAV